MLRLAVIVLLLANAGYFAWSQHWLGGLGLVLVSESEPERLRQQIHATADPALLALQAELLEYPAPEESPPLVMAGEMLGVVMPFCFESVHGMLSLISTTTIFGTPVDVTLQELAVESFFPADAFTAQVLREMAQQYAAD